MQYKVIFRIKEENQLVAEALVEAESRDLAIINAVSKLERGRIDLTSANAIEAFPYMKAF